MEEDEVLNMLSENLSFELSVHLNGSRLHETPAFKHFSIEFLAELTGVLKKETYTSGDKIIIEEDYEQKMYFIVDGFVVISQKSTKTKIAEIGAECIFGEVSFFSGQPRSASCTCRGFAEIMSLDLADCENILENDDEALDIFE